MRLPSAVLLICVPSVPVLAAAQDAGIEHQPVSCLVAGRFPRLSACVPEPDGVANARVYFRAEGTGTWYHVIMSREAGCFSAALPKPKRDLLGRHVEYYVEADHRRLGSPRTAEYRAVVVPDEGACTGFVAKLAKAAPKAVFPALPAGFAAGGAASVGTAAIVGAGAAAAGGAAVAVGAAGGGDDGPPSTTAPPATEPTDSTIRPTTTTRPDSPTLALECSATPDSGPLPLTVRFDAGAVGVSVSPSFVWDFGDGSGATGSQVQHVYSAAGRYTATVTGTAGNATGTCARQVAAAVAPVATGRLSVKIGGGGSGSVSSSPSGLDCRAACSAPFPLDSEVALKASPQADSRFTGWSGACTTAGSVNGGGGECSVKITGDVAVEAEFERVLVPAQAFQLTVTREGTSGTVVRSSPPGIECGGDCDEKYPAGTRVSLGLVGVSAADFKEWAGDCSDSGPCSFVMDRDRNVTARFSGPPAPTTTTTTTTTMPPLVPLSVALAGQGNGRVTGAGINCPGTCAAGQAAGSTVTIQAQAGASSVFSGWQGDCFGQSANCTLTMSSARTARAVFDALYRLDVSIQGTGRVQSDSLINCPPTCTETRVDGAVVTLLAQTVAGGGAFQGWGGACAAMGTEQSCEVKMDRHQAVSARFDGISVPVRPAGSAWRSILDAPGARGTVRVGAQSFAVEPGERLFEHPPAEETVVEALVTAGRGGTWRFEAADAGAVEPGSLRVIAGEALSIGPASIAFRIGRDARVVFAYRTRSRP